jgi:UDP-N-acetylglucosamine 2-epimerase (non-hydrolysing)
MKKKKILITFGTRPEAIKLAPLVLAFKRCPDFAVTVCVTAQHRTMLDQVLEFFGIAPDYDLDLMQNDQTLFGLTSNVLLNIKTVLEDAAPDYVFIQGDTTTAFAVALSSFYFRIPVCHVEAGLRTNNIYSPFPEEMNRQLASRICRFHFAPTQRAQQNLQAEHIPEEAILVTGNTVIDALFEARKRLRPDSAAIRMLKKEINFDNSSFRRRIVVTGHRRENFGEGLENLCRALKALAREHPDIQIVYPVHLNPNVQKPAYSLLGNIDNIRLLEPLDYEAFIWLMDTAYCIITDSGGIQEEAPALGKPVLLTRDTTERPEAIEAGTVKMIGTSTERIITETNSLLLDSRVYGQMSTARNPYGDGRACERIISFMRQRLSA